MIECVLITKELIAKKDFSVILKGKLTTDLKVLNPCNRSGCNEDYLCDFGSNSDMCPKAEYRSHMRDWKIKCSVKDLTFCTDHLNNHLKNFTETEDIFSGQKCFLS